MTIAVTEIEQLNKHEIEALGLLIGVLSLNPSASNDCQDNLLSCFGQLFDLLCDDLSGR